MSALLELEQQAKLLKCACGGRLVVAWLDGKYQIRCGRDKTHTEFIKPGDPVVDRFERMKESGLASSEEIDAEIETYKIQEENRATAKRTGNWL